jgi:hypothetical protein
MSMRCKRLLAEFPAAVVRAPLLLACALLVSTACDSFAAARASAPTPAPFTPVPGADARADPCAVAVPNASTAVETVTADDGACVTPSTLVLYRCDPSQEMVAVADIAGAGRRFLGGAYAVHVDALPADAHQVGVTGAGRISTTPGDRALYVESGGRIERWLALPNSGAVSSPTAFMVGDSILDGGQDDVVAGLPEWDVTIDALIGRSSSGGITPAESLLQLPNVVVVELGVNDVSDTSFAANAERILAAVQGADLVVWVTAHGPEPVTDQIDRTIVADMGALRNGAILDWDRLVPPDLLGSDGVHPTTGQEGLLASFLAPFLQGWREATAGRGATACEGDLANAIAG